jgi:hypothetical protein
MKNHTTNVLRSTKKLKKMNLFIFGISSLLWFIFRTGTKPSRIIYPCQKAALVNSSILLGITIPIAITSGIGKTKSFVAKKVRSISLIILLVVLILNGQQFLGSILPTKAANPNQEIYINLQPHQATIHPSSNIYVVKDSTYAHINELVNLMSANGLDFFKSNVAGQNKGPEGLFAKDDVILIKVNSQWDSRGGTNTDLLKELIQVIIEHPDNFVGEIVVADNGQAQYGSAGNGGSLDWAKNNAEDQSQSVQDVVDSFTENYVSTYLWDTITLNRVNEYSEGDIVDGYIVNQTQNSETEIQVSYPKFQTMHGTYISFKKGIWDPTTQTYNNQQLKIINLPVLKTHGLYGVTETTKHYMGVVSAKQTNAHQKVGTGGMGTEMVETRFPTLNILDAIWVNANPPPSFNSGPSTSYGESTKVNIILASTDPLALAYYGSKNVLQQTAELIGYTNTNSINPDNTKQTFGNWLKLTKQQISQAGYQVTTQEDQMNIFVRAEVPPPEIENPIQTPLPDNVTENDEVTVQVNITDIQSGIKNVTLYYAINSTAEWISKTMNHNSQTNLYEAKIPPQPIGTKIDYRITAYNNAEKSTTKEANQPYYSYQVIIPEFSPQLLMIIFVTLSLSIIILKKRKVTA